MLQGVPQVPRGRIAGSQGCGTRPHAKTAKGDVVTSSADRRRWSQRQSLGCNQEATCNSKSCGRSYEPLQADERPCTCARSSSLMLGSSMSSPAMEWAEKLVMAPLRTCRQVLTNVHGEVFIIDAPQGTARHFTESFSRTARNWFSKVKLIIQAHSNYVRQAPAACFATD